MTEFFKIYDILHPARCEVRWFLTKKQRRMKIRKFLMPYGSAKKIQKLIEERKLYVPANSTNGLVSEEVIRKVLKGYDRDNWRICSDKLANIIYDLAPEVGGMEIKQKKNDRQRSQQAR